MTRLLKSVLSCALHFKLSSSHAFDFSTECRSDLSHAQSLKEACLARKEIANLPKAGLQP